MSSAVFRKVFLLDAAVKVLPVVYILLADRLMTELVTWLVEAKIQLCHQTWAL